MTFVIVLSCEPLKSRSGTGGMKQMWSDADLIREELIKQWKEPELIRAIAKRDVESEMSDGVKETGR